MKNQSIQQLTIKSQDILVLLKLAALGEKSATYAQLAEALGMSASEVHASIKRARVARLVSAAEGRPAVIRSALKELLLHGAQYVFPATLGSVTRGMVTAYAAPPLASRIAQPAEAPPVWPDPHGTQRGVSFSPLYPTVPMAARADATLYEYLALFDAIRGGSARERQMAAALLEERLA